MSYSSRSELSYGSRSRITLESASHSSPGLACAPFRAAPAANRCAGTWVSTTKRPSFTAPSSYPAILLSGHLAGDLAGHVGPQRDPVQLADGGLRQRGHQLQPLGPLQRPGTSRPEAIDERLQGEVPGPPPPHPVPAPPLPHTPLPP